MGAIIVILMLLASPLRAQIITGAVTGTVYDTTGSVVPTAKLTLSAEATGAQRVAASDGAGNFVFSAVVPGIYALTIEAGGFKKFVKSRLVVNPNETLAAGELRLEVGAVSDSVTVTAEGGQVQIASSERSGLLTGNQVEGLTVINRDFAALTALLPGVVENPGAETQGYAANATFNVQGAQNISNTVLVDGVAMTQGNGTAVAVYNSVDTVATVRIITSAYQAEFGRKPGASIQALTKSGGKEFHGSLYGYKRHEQFNANSFFNNRDRIAEPRYRFTTAGFTVGGPVSIPGVFNRGRNRLFFFVGDEHLRELRPQPIRQFTMPTEAERQGDFSRSFDLNGALIPVRDPLNNKQPFPGNVAPAGRVDRSGQNYLRLLPLPNFDNLAISARRYNWVGQESLEIPKRTTTARVDLPLNSNTSVYGRWNRWHERIAGWAVPAQNTAWGWLPSYYSNLSYSGVISATRILNPSTILEASVSMINWVEEANALRQEDVERLTRSKAGYSAPQLYPQNNSLDLVPNASFGGINLAPTTGIFTRFGGGGTDRAYSWNVIFTRTAGAHVVKAGAAGERWRHYKTPNGNFNGTINFGRSVDNVLDSNHPYANALLGNFNSYTESTTRPERDSRQTIVEWFIQDNWKAKRRLTVDYGVRFARAQPYHESTGREAGFEPSRYNPARAVSLIRPVLSGGQRSGWNPLTGEIVPAVLIGAIVPGSGTAYNGMVDRSKEPAYPKGFQNDVFRVAPRLGFSWDPFGKGRTALRSGFGVFYDVKNINFLTGVLNPPIRVDPIAYYGTLSSIRTLAQMEFPSVSVQGLNPKDEFAQMMNFSFGVQQEIGFKTIADVSYVGNLGRHLLQRRNINSVPLGANFLPANRDPASSGSPLAPSFLRPYLGYNDILYNAYDGTSNYHSLQATVNRRFTKGLEFGAAWTWSKAMNYSDSLAQDVSYLIDNRVWNYGRAGFDRTHILKINWVYDLPRFSRYLRNRVVAAAGDGWQVSGIASFVSGAPSGISMAFTYVNDITGSPSESPRVVVTQNPILPKNERTFSRNFKTEAFSAPTVGSLGNAPKNVIRGPGINNWDLSAFKRIPLPGERLRLQFRAEFYNAFNHTQFSGLDVSARFDQQVRQTNARFGEFTAARQPRRIQLALRLTF